MDLEWNFCPGCDGKEKKDVVNKDHYHQYIGGLGGTVTVYYIDEKAWPATVRGDMDAVRYLIKVLECTFEEAQAYLSSLPRVYN